MSGLSLRLYNSSTSESTTTDGSGAYQLAVPDGTYDLSASSESGSGDLPGAFLGYGTGLVVSGDVTANYTLAADPVDVTVLGPDGAPVVGAVVATGGDIFGGSSSSLLGITYNSA